MVKFVFVKELLFIDTPSNVLLMLLIVVQKMFQYFYLDSWCLMECSIKPSVLKFLKTLYAFRSVVPVQVWMTPPPPPSTIHRAKHSNEPDKFETLIVPYFSRSFWRILFASKQKWNHQKEW